MHYEATYLGPYGSISTGWRRLEYGEPRLIVASEKDRLIREHPDWVLIVTEGDRYPIHRGARLPQPVAIMSAPLPVEPAAAVAPPPPEPVAPEAVDDFGDLTGDVTPEAVGITTAQVAEIAPKAAVADVADITTALNTFPNLTEADLRAYPGVGASTARRLLALREQVS